MYYKFFRRFASLMLALVITFAGYSPALAAPPDAPALISPSGNIGVNNSPSFIWNEAPGATEYELFINGPTGTVLDQSYQTSDICNSGTCTVQSPVVLGNGAHTWFVQAWNPEGYGPWSSGMNFSIAMLPPDAPALISPSGNIGVNNSPSFIWNEAPGATEYRLFINGPSGTTLDQSYQASVICNSGTCTVQSPVILGDGAHIWFVQAWNPEGYGPWSSGMNFSIAMLQLVANFYFSPNNPSSFDTIQFYDQSNDPAQLGFQSFTWDFGDGTTSTDQSPTHKYASDGDYTVQHSVTTTDGRTASTSQVVQVRTHDVSLTKVEAPESTKVGKSEKITVSVVNTSSYSESVRVDLYRSVSGGGFEFVGTLTKNSASNLRGDRPTKYTFNYTFVAGDAAIGKVIFRAVTTIENAPDAFPQDNERLSSVTIVKQKK